MRLCGKAVILKIKSDRIMKLVKLPGNYLPRRLTFYLAMEEYVAREMPAGHDYFFTWQSEPTVIAGRNQLIEAEADTEYCRRNGIAVVRRKSGGGCVYSDMGNLMLSCVTDGGQVGFVFDRYLRRIALALSKKGIAAQVSGRNDITVEGRKVSGNAFLQLPGGRCIIHGTLLCETDLGRMERALTPATGKLESKGVASVRSRVVNLKDIAGTGTEEMRLWMEREMCDGETLLGDDAVGRIKEIEKTYLDPLFVGGKNPPFTITRRVRTAGGEVCLKADVRNGIIKSVSLTGDFLSCGDPSGTVGKALAGRRFSEEEARKTLEGIDMRQYISGLTTEKFIETLFKP